MAASGERESKIRTAFQNSPLHERTFYQSHGSYEESQQSYFSNQNRSLTPLCIVKPQTTDEVSSAIKTLASLYNEHGSAVNFAVRSGGHTVWPGAANIDGGITLDLRSLNEVTIHKDRDEVTVGTGAIWADVYDALGHENLTVPGGRVANVGVGGLILGGGLSFFSPRKGFVCDNVVAYEIVLADGAIAHITQGSHSDLWWALKGGASNFGVVTRFTLRSFAAGAIWGGCFVYDLAHAPAFLDAFHAFATTDAAFDDHAAVISTYSFREHRGMHVFNSLEYTKPEPEPPVLQPFLRIADPLYSTGRITTQTDLTKEQAALSSDNFQQCYMTTTIRADRATLHRVFALWRASVPAVESVPGICWALGFQVLSPAVTRTSAARGGNCMGLDDAPTLVIVLLTNFWRDAADNERLVGLTRGLIGEFEAAARENGADSKFKYLNYAWGDQRVFEGYGEENRAKLRAVARKYDPEGFFQTAMPGGFKLF